MKENIFRSSYFKEYLFLSTGHK